MKKITIDLEKAEVVVYDDNGSTRHPLATQNAFSAVSDAWLRCGWDNKYVYSFTWMGRPVIQLPEDMIRMQEVIYQVKPDVIIETGVAHGGSLIFYASLCKAMDRGHVIGIDIEIRPHNRSAIEAHELFSYITLIEGSSVDANIIAQVRAQVKPTDKVLVILDSNHSKQHVLQELQLYSPLVTRGSYIVATDGIMANLVGAPRSNEDWSWNNPKAAAEEFLTMNKDFILEQPKFPFNEGNITEMVTYWPSAWLQRV